MGWALSPTNESVRQNSSEGIAAKLPTFNLAGWHCSAAVTTSSLFAAAVFVNVRARSMQLLRAQLRKNFIFMRSLGSALPRLLRLIPGVDQIMACHSGDAEPRYADRNSHLVVARPGCVAVPVGDMWVHR